MTVFVCPLACHSIFLLDTEMLTLRNCSEIMNLNPEQTELVRSSSR